MFSIFLLLPSLGVDAQKRQMRAMWEQLSVRWAVACIVPKMDDQAGELNGKGGAFICDCTGILSPLSWTLLSARSTSLPSFSGS